MSAPGSNLPGFRDAQLAFAAHIRDPQENPRPPDIEPRRMKIYLDLFYNNIENFLSSGFPIAKRILEAAQRWHPLVRRFVAEHPSASPYFLEISQEFLTFLGDRDDPELPDFLLELCHYEWVELALSVSEIELNDVPADPLGDLKTAPIVVSPLIWKLAYHYPVHQIGEHHQPDQTPDAPTFLVVNRRRNDQIGFVVSNALTLKLLDLLAEQPLAVPALDLLANEYPDLDRKTVHDHGIATLEQLRDAEVLLGTEPAN